MMADCPRGIVFDVQRFSLHDGPGLRTTAFLKGCPLHCRWCQNPESLQHQPAISVTLERCIGCDGCRAACPTGALAQGPACIDRVRCDGCGQCVPGCPSETLALVGRTVEAATLADELAADRVFFEASGGGVTLSGGEPTAQPEFCAALVRELRARRIAVGIETCGLFRWERVCDWLSELDFVLFDLKIMDPERHRRHTGAGNAAILANARQLVAAGLPVRFRTPVVPGFTDDDDNLLAIGRFVAGLGARSVALLRYHAMGEAKLVRVGATTAPLGVDARSTAEHRTAYAAALLESLGLEVTT